MLYSVLLLPLQFLKLCASVSGKLLKEIRFIRLGICGQCSDGMFCVYCILLRDTTMVPENILQGKRNFATFINAQGW